MTDATLSIAGRAQTAIERGEFQHGNGRVREDAILAVAGSVAWGMQLLHKHSVQHGNLCASAVLLTACKVLPFPLIKGMSSGLRPLFVHALSVLETGRCLPQRLNISLSNASVPS